MLLIQRYILECEESTVKRTQECSKWQYIVDISNRNRQPSHSPKWKSQTLKIWSEYISGSDEYQTVNWSVLWYWEWGEVYCRVVVSEWSIITWVEWTRWGIKGSKYGSDRYQLDSREYRGSANQTVNSKTVPLVLNRAIWECKSMGMEVTYHRHEFAKQSWSHLPKWNKWSQESEAQLNIVQKRIVRQSELTIIHKSRWESKGHLECIS